MYKKIIDITREIHSGIAVWPGDPGITMERTSSFEKGNGSTVTRVSLGLHTSTHIDMPLHFIEGGKTLDEADLTKFAGRCKIFEITSDKAITKNDIENLDIQKGDIVLFKTKNSNYSLDEPFKFDFIYLDLDAAEYLTEKGVKTIGIDYLSIEAFGSREHKVHKTLLEKEIVLIEGLDLKNVEPGNYFLSCLPLKLKGCEASPVRAVLFVF